MRNNCKKSVFFPLSFYYKTKELSRINYVKK